MSHVLINTFRWPATFSLSDSWKLVQSLCLTEPCVWLFASSAMWGDVKACLSVSGGVKVLNAHSYFLAATTASHHHPQWSFFALKYGTVSVSITSSQTVKPLLSHIFAHKCFRCCFLQHILYLVLLFWGNACVSVKQPAVIKDDYSVAENMRKQSNSCVRPNEATFFPLRLCFCAAADACCGELLHFELYCPLPFCPWFLIKGTCFSLFCYTCHIAAKRFLVMHVQTAGRSAEL